MDPVKLKASYGDWLCFWFSIDTQQNLPFGNVEDVRHEVIARLKTIGAGGGLIIEPTHKVQMNTLLENIWALMNYIQQGPYHLFS
jgi:uroporphyrinogen decarboxylase